MRHQLLASMLNDLRRRGLGFYINVGLWGTAAVVLAPLYQHTSLRPVLWGYSLPLLIGLAIVTGAGLILLLLVLTQGARFNRTLCVAMLLTGACLEGGARWLPGNTPLGEDIGRFPKPYVMFGGQPNGRSAGGAQTKAPDEVRVIVVGGSAVLHGSAPDQTIPGHLATLLRPAGFHRTTVYNFGSLSYVSGQELALLLHTVVDYQPEVVVVYDGGNDLYLPYVADPRPG